MICRMRPRKPFVSDEAPTTATERGHSSFPISGTKPLRTRLRSGDSLDEFPDYCGSGLRVIARARRELGGLPLPLRERVGVRGFFVKKFLRSEPLTHQKTLQYRTALSRKGREGASGDSSTRENRSAQAEAAGNDAAQDLRGAALNGELGSDHGGERNLLLQRRAIGRLGLEEGGELAHARGQFLLPHGAQILDDRALDHRLLAGLQH